MQLANNEINFTQHLESLIKRHLEKDKLDNAFLARQLCLSEAQFYRKVKKDIGCTPNALVRKIRLLVAFQLLKDGQLSVREVAFAVGFTHVGYFIRRFEEYYGSSPGTILRNA